METLMSIIAGLAIWEVTPSVANWAGDTASAIASEPVLMICMGFALFGLVGVPAIRAILKSRKKSEKEEKVV